MRTALSIALKDLRIRSRDISAFLILLAMPVALIMLLSAALGGLGAGEPDFTIKVAIVNLDIGGETEGIIVKPAMPTGDLGKTLSDAFTETDGITKLFDITVADDAAAVRKQVAQGDLAAALIIPEDFSDAVLAARPVELEVISDPGSSQAAGAWESVVRAVANRFAASSVVVRGTISAVAEAAGGTPDPQTVGRATELAMAAVESPGALDRIAVEESAAETGPEITALDFYGLSMTAMFLLFGAMYGAFSTLEEKRQRTLARLHSAPVSRGTVTAGKIVGIFFIGFAQFTVLYLFTRFSLGVYWGESAVATFAVAGGELIATAGLASLIAALAKNERGAGGIGPLIIQVQALIGGTFFSFASLPDWFRYLQWASVPGWALTAWEDIQLRGAGLADVWFSVAVLVGWGVLFWGIATWRQKAVAS